MQKRTRGMAEVVDLLRRALVQIPVLTKRKNRKKRNLASEVKQCSFQHLLFIIVSLRTY
jgi:hypothetical protein